jgi:uncharacterized protein (TIGR00369 family)
MGKRELSRLVTWRSPDPGFGASMTGADFLKALARGDMPNLPFGELLRIRATAVRDGQVVFACVPDESMYNAIGMIHGGILCTLLDTVTSAAVWSTLPAGQKVVSVEIKVNYLRGVRLDDRELIATGTAVKVGSRVGFAEADVKSDRGVAVATASSTVLIVGA